MLDTKRVSPGPHGALPDLVETQHTTSGSLEDRASSTGLPTRHPTLNKCLNGAVTGVGWPYAIFELAVLCPPMAVYCACKGVAEGAKRLYHCAHDAYDRHHAHDGPPSIQR